MPGLLLEVEWGSVGIFESSTNEITTEAGRGHKKRGYCKTITPYNS